MPKSAYRGTKTGIPVDASSCTINDVGKKFICCTEGCNAEMILVNAANPLDAYFRSKVKSQHISNKCIKNSIIFNTSKFAENRFDINFAFDSMLGKRPSIQRGTTGTKHGHVGGSRQLRIHTLPMLYAMCISKEKSDSYNGILIDNILVDNENFDKYSGGIKGNKIVETSKYFHIIDQLSFIMNYPANNFGKSSWVKIMFEDKKMFWHQYNKLKNSNHIEPVIIAGEWEPVAGNPRFHSQCVIHSENQIYYATEQ